MEENGISKRRVIRWGIVIMLIATPLGFLVDGLLEFPIQESSSKESAVLAEFDEIKTSAAKSDIDQDSIYTNFDLGFQVLRPTNNWEIHPVSERIEPEKFQVLKSRGLIDGIYLEENHEKQFMITVSTIPDDFELDRFVNLQIAQLEMQTDVEVPKKEISLDKDHAVFAMKIPTENWNYGEQVLFLKDGKLFMLQYSGQDPDSINYEKGLEYRAIMDSFETI